MKVIRPPGLSIMRPHGERDGRETGRNATAIEQNFVPSPLRRRLSA